MEARKMTDPLNKLQELFSAPLSKNFVDNSSLIDKGKNQKEHNIFRYGSESFALPLENLEAVGKETIINEMNKLYAQLKNTGNEAKRFIREARKFPIIADLIARQRLSNKNPFIPGREYRYQVFWKPKTSRDNIDWNELFDLMKEMNLTQDEILCHARINILRINLNTEIALLDSKLKYLSLAATEMIQMDSVLGKRIPNWLNVK